MKGRARVWSHMRYTGATNQSYGRKGRSTAVIRKRMFPWIRTFEDELQTKDVTQKRERKIEGGRREKWEDGWLWVNKTPCGTSTTGVSECSKDSEIGLKLKIELSSLLPRSSKFTLRTFHIRSSRYVPFVRFLAARRMTSLFSFDGCRCRPPCKAGLDASNPVESYFRSSSRSTYRVFSFHQMTTVAIRVPLMEFSSQIGFSSSCVHPMAYYPMAENLQRVKFARVDVRRREIVRHYFCC